MAMNKIKIITAGLLLTGLLSAARGEAGTLPSLTLTPQDKILIFAPHPDDEAIGTAGIIQKASALGIPVHVVYLTYGENNQLAFFVYKKHPVLKRSGLLKMGEVRRKEAVTATNFLGLAASRLIFLGYPDFGTTEIFTKYWGDTRPFKSMLARVTAVPYRDAFAYEKSFKGENVLEDIKKILTDFQPTKIFVTLPADTNPDHRACYLFLQVALWDLEGRLPAPEVYPYIIHVVGWPLPRGLHPELPLDIPEKLSDADVTWWTFPLAPPDIDKKAKAISFYKSQGAYNPEYLYSFARKNELFGRFSDIALRERGAGASWNDLVTGQKIVSHLAEEGRPNRNIIRAVAYTRQGENLSVRLAVNQWESKISGINLFLIGYKKGTDFSQMPKIRININFDRFISVFDKLDRVFVKDMQFSQDKNILQVEFPLSSLGNPDKILSCVKTYIADWPLETTPWRVLTVDDHASPE